MHLATAKGTVAGQLNKPIPHRRAVFEDGETLYECRSVCDRFCEGQRISPGLGTSLTAMYSRRV